MMDEVPDAGMAQRRAIDMAAARVPDPLAGGIGAGAGMAGAEPAGDRDRQQRQHARHAAGDPCPPQQVPRLQVLVAGAGLVGAALAAALRGRGHQVRSATRPGREDSLPLDFEALPPAGELVQELAGMDVVVNTVGLFRAGAEQTFDAVHVKAPLALQDAARTAGVRRFVHVSALGADAGSRLPYLRSKGRGDSALLAAPGISTTVVRPSLVFSPDGASTRWFAMLSVLPLTPVPAGRARIQPLHLEDLVAILVALVEADASGPAVVEAVGPRPLTLREYLGLFKARVGSGGFVRVPRGIAAALARLASAWRRAPFDADALSMLDAGNTADASPARGWRGADLRDPATFLDSAGAARLRREAWLRWLLPAMRATLAAMWIGTAVVSLWVHPRGDSLALLGQVGLTGPLATASLWVAACLDLALGLALFVPRWRAAAYAMQLVLVLGYTAIITAWLPGQWAHPFGPVLKNLPLLAMIATLWALDRADGPDRR
jgi:uncharacterized protein YbjT (DUF2867 family)/uncharacterized membrane protein